MRAGALEVGVLLRVLVVQCSDHEGHSATGTSQRAHQQFLQCSSSAPPAIGNSVQSWRACGSSMVERPVPK